MSIASAGSTNCLPAPMISGSERKCAIGALPHPCAQLIRLDDEVGVERRERQVRVPLFAEIEMKRAGREHLDNEDRALGSQGFPIRLTRFDQNLREEHANLERHRTRLGEYASKSTRLNS